MYIKKSYETIYVLFQMFIRSLSHFLKISDIGRLSIESKRTLSNRSFIRQVEKKANNQSNYF